MSDNLDYDYPAAQADGWFISHHDSGADGTSLRLERDDEAAIFETDDAAAAHVCRLAIAGDRNARRALAVLKAREPIEFGIVLAGARRHGVAYRWDEHGETFGEPGQKVWVSVYTTGEDVDITLHMSAESAEALRRKTAREQWDDEIGKSLPKPRDPEELADTYFDHMGFLDDEENFDILERYIETYS